MAKARVFSKNVKLFLFSEDTLAPIFLGEIDSFKKTSNTKIIKSRDIGYVNEQATVDYGGWDLSFDGGKVDWRLARFYLIQDRYLRDGIQPPELYILETIKHYNGTIEQYSYRHVTLFGFEGEHQSQQESTESIQGFSPYRQLGPVDTVIIKDAAQVGIMELIFAAAGKGIQNNIDREF
jgi:hypothetical protein